MHLYKTSSFCRVFSVIPTTCLHRLCHLAQLYYTDSWQHISIPNIIRTVMNSTLYTFIKDVECTYLSDSFLLLILKAYAAFKRTSLKGVNQYFTYHLKLNDMPALNLFSEQLVIINFNLIQNRLFKYDVIFITEFSNVKCM